MKTIEIQEKLAPIMAKYGIKHAAVFGSVSRGDDRPESDVDILIEIGQPMGLFTYSRFIQEMEDLLQRKVDVVTNNSINKFIKPYILPELKTIYEK